MSFLLKYLTYIHIDGGRSVAYMSHESGQAEPHLIETIFANTTGTSVIIITVYYIKKRIFYV